MKRVGLIAGNGRFPLLFARGARQLGVEVIAVAHEGETDPALGAQVDAITWVRVGQLERIIRTFRDQGIRRAVMAGGIRKATLFQSFHPDERARAFLARLEQWGDDAVLRGVASELESEGIEIVESTVFLGFLLTPAGCLTRRRPDEGEWRDVRHGVRVAHALGEWDVGQTVVVKDGVVLAVEAIEGTDVAVRRGGAFGGGTVVVKVSKPRQDLRFDVPAIGPDTVAVCREAGVRVIALEAGRTLMLDRERIVQAADQFDLSIVGVASEADG